ncbi:MAG TPA: hypothetical protein VLA34_05315, partial [Candidatus Krumholzibacterium sp.]|nr:hypothetical protein [Candidatus Krumholzibacterium sp.]
MDLSIEASKRGRGLRILVTRLRFLGDIIISTAAVACLRKRYPEADIYYLAEVPYAEILEENPDIDGIIRLEKSTGG